MLRLHVFVRHRSAATRGMGARVRQLRETWRYFGVRGVSVWGFRGWSAVRFDAGNRARLARARRFRRSVAGRNARGALRARTLGIFTRF